MAGVQSVSDIPSVLSGISSYTIQQPVFVVHMHVIYADSSPVLDGPPDRKDYSAVSAELRSPPRTRVPAQVLIDLLANRVRLEMKAALAALQSLRIGDDLTPFTSPPNPFREIRDYLWKDPSKRISLIYHFGMVLAKKEVIPAMEFSMFIKNLQQALLPIEEDHPDYASVAQASIGISHKNLGDHLVELAKQFLLELRECHTHIPFSPIYQAAAKNALQHSATATESLEDFTAWFSLEFTDIRKLILHAPLTNMSLIIQFALICSEKGQVIPSIMRFASPDEQHQQYLKQYHGRIFQSVMRGSAIRSLAYADMLPPKRATYFLSAYTCDVLNNFLYLPLLGYLRTMHDSLLQDYAQSSITSQFTSQTHTLPYDDRSERSFSPGHAPPHPSTLINFFNAYVDSGRSRAIDLLRRKALRSSPIATTVFVFTQMITYYRLNQHHLVLQTFVDNFYITGVPRAEVIACLKVQQGVLAKLWPTAYHTALVWHSLVATTSTSVKVEVLYKKLIATASSFSVNSVCAAAFTPFMGKLMRSSGVERGIQPTAYHFTELAGYYASTGNAQRALFLLGRLETAFDQQVPISEKEIRETESPSIEHTRPVPASVPNALPVPSFVMYVSLMRGFLISQNFDAVAEVNERMLKRYDYTPGQNSYLDAVYSDWQMKQEGNRYPIRPLPVIKYRRVQPVSKSLLLWSLEFMWRNDDRVMTPHDA
ncbi:hypothetical protein EV421DRAFT_1769294 [Armillaria borealis]|uniref:Uncharacterized protein n=1 Tax=Armillaria borealis TaxID=47425 RepID=A0AA39MZC8_9AGAR|nr:hypothetical protein EV421DRAFT_1769294 [Armillaria borealis]